MSAPTAPEADRPVPDIAGRDVGRSSSEAASPLSRDYVEVQELIVAVERIARSLGRRVGIDGDLDALAGLCRLRIELDGAVTSAVAGLRNDERYPASWSEIAGALGVTRRAAIQRFGHVGGLRRPGGQPGNLR